MRACPVYCKYSYCIFPHATLSLQEKGIHSGNLGANLPGKNDNETQVVIASHQAISSSMHFPPPNCVPMHFEETRGEFLVRQVGTCTVSMARGREEKRVNRTQYHFILCNTAAYKRLCHKIFDLWFLFSSYQRLLRAFLICEFKLEIHSVGVVV